MLIHFQQNFHKLQLLNLFPYRSFSSTIKIFVIRRPGSASRRGGRSGFENDIKDLKLYEFDSITKDGFELLLAQSEVRKYLHKAKHEIPKLAEFAEAFKPPKSKEILCFKRQYYIGENNHLQNKAVMTVNVDKLELSSAEKHKFLLICGPRYDGENTIKFSYDKFPNYAQNKNYLGDLLNKILEEVKNPNADKFEDIPLDLRHIKKNKKSFKFPIEWVKKSEDLQTQESTSTPTTSTPITSTSTSTTS